MNLNTSSWRPFILANLYEIVMGDKLDKNKTSQDNPTVNFVSRISYNNGVDAVIDRIDGLTPHPAGLLTVSLGGEYLGSCYIQKAPFYTAQNIAIMKPRTPEMTFEVNIFVCSLVKYECKTKYYAFGRELNTHIRTDFEIYLPVQLDNMGMPVIDSNNLYSSEGYIPDWKFMEDYIKSLHHKPITTAQYNNSSDNVNVTEWKRFSLGKLFQIKKGKRLTAEDQTEGNNIYIGAIDNNNGVANKIGQSPIHKGNTISLSYNGSVGEAFYQSEPYWATDDVNALYSKYDGFNKYIGLFIVAVIRKEKYRFNYGRKWTLENMRETEICLPIKRYENNAPVIDDTYSYSEQGFIPDWGFMENFIKNLPFGDRI